MNIYSRSKLIAIWGFLILLAAACGQQPGASKKFSGGPPEVAVVTIQPQRFVSTTELTGRTSANLIAEVRPQVSGIIQRRLFTEGADVKAGETLFLIDPAPYQAALDNAMAAHSRSEANLSAIRLRAERVRDLLNDKAVSRQDYDDAAAALKQVEADVQYWKAMVETARINLKYTSVTSPISGRIGKSQVTEGALVTAHQAVSLATIQKLDPMYVDVRQSTTEVLRLRRLFEEGRFERGEKKQSNVRLIMDDGTSYPWEGTLKFRDITVDPSTGSVVLRVIFPNPRGILLPGMFVRAIVEEGVNKKAILVPQQAVFRNHMGKPMVMIVDAEDKAAQRQIAVERTVGDKWLVSSGLTAGERVIVEGSQRARPGSQVKVVPFEGKEIENAQSKPAPKSN